ncbi:MAG: hypothetical protein LBD37_04415 [Treponema sp.]|jgi:hypothetical protein|nr:hypothetical protein [Treponema sp.]
MLKRKTKVIAVLAIAAAALLALGGYATSGGGNTPQPGADIFADEQGSLLVTNDAEFDVVLFAGKPESAFCKNRRVCGD